MLPPATEKVWEFLQRQPALSGFVLIGRSALALRIAHRLSEYLDLVFPGRQLPRIRLDAMRQLAETSGFTFQRNDDEAALEEFAHADLELYDYQQNFVVNEAVKVSFFVPESSVSRILGSSVEPRVRVATLAELFKTKCLVSAVRSKTRDWLDLYLLLRDYGFTIQDYQAAFQEADQASQCDLGLARLCSGMPSRNDEGYTHLLANPPRLENIKAFFIEQRDELERTSAAKAPPKEHRK